MKPLNYGQPNIGPHTGPDRVYFARYDGGQFFHRRGGKFVDGPRSGLYRLADANSSTLAGFTETEQFPHPVAAALTTSSGDRIPTNFGLEASAVIPTTGRLATVNDVGHCFDLVTVGLAANQSLIQYINMNSTAYGIVQISQLPDRSGSVVACVIPTPRRLGNL